jgi:diaminopimelate epimerase
LLFVHLTKHHGLGNDFLIVLDEANDGPVAPDAELARRLCARHTGLGADGLIHGGAGTDGADISFRLWNSDGSKAEVSGNGLRCLAQAVARFRGFDTATVGIGTVAGLRRAEVRPAEHPHVADVEVEMGPVVEIPAVGEREPIGINGPDDAHYHDIAAGTTRGVRVSVGNPHLVLLASEPAGVDLATWGPFYERRHEGGINVEFIAPAGPDTIDLVVWERGSGITQACGSGATAAAHVAHEWGLVGNEVAVRMPGGTATVRLTPEGAFLRGPTTFVAEIEVPDA